MRILVVDDQEDHRDLTEGALLSAGYTDIVTAASGWDAFKVLDVGCTTDEDPPVDVVLLDIVMPEMDGVEVCARIRNDPRYADLPIIMVTSLDDGMNLVAKEFVAAREDEEGVLILSRFAGASGELRDALVVNPYDVEQLAEAIRFGLEMDPEGKKVRMRRMRQGIREFNIYRWAADLIKELA